MCRFPFTPAGWTILLLNVPIGLGCELPFLLVRYRSVRLPLLMAGGVAATLLVVGMTYVPLGMANLAPLAQGIGIALFTASGALLGGVLARMLSDALARTGVLSRYAVGQRR